MSYLIFFVGGYITSLGFAPLNLWFAPIAGLGIWYTLLMRYSVAKNIFGSYLFGLGVLLPNQIWTGIYVGNTPWLILCGFQALFFLLPAWLISKKRRFNTLIFPLSLVVVELLLRTTPFTGFGWSRYGFTQNESPLRSLFPLGGVVLVTFALAYVATIRRFKPFIFVSLLLGITHLIPSQVIKTASTDIFLVQGGVRNLGLDFNATPRQVFNDHLSVTKKILSQSNLIIWPENSVDIDLFKNTDIKNLILDQSKRLRTPILVGGVTQSDQGLRNQTFLFNPDITQIYTKRYLTPFGEYLPLRKISEKFSPYAQEITDFKAGQKDQIFLIPNTSFQTLICYELLNDRFTDSIKSDFLVVQSNNATFGDTAQLEQQLNIARVRAQETGRSIAYVSTTGVTSFISNSGKIEKQLPKFKPDSLFSSIDLVEGITITQRFGKFLEPLAIMALLILKYRRFAIH